MKNMKTLILISSLIVCLVLIIEAYNVNIASDWRTYQKTYKKELLKLAKDDGERQVAKGYEIMMRQIVLPELGRMDRCVSCHVGMDDPRMSEMEHPIKSHPASVLENHELEKVGCTICHDGQGRAMKAHVAHAQGDGYYWEKPVLPGPFVQSNCARCHFNTLASNENYNNGFELFIEKGCLRCHKANGKGGIIGPDLSNISNDSFHVKGPTHDNRHDLLEKFKGNVNIAYLYESVKDARAQPENSTMTEYDLTDEAAVDLSVYLKSLSVGSVPKHLLSTRRPELPDTSVERGERYYAMYCMGCHGRNGEGGRFEELKIIVPAVANEEFLSIIDKDFLTHAVSYGRGGQMAAYISNGGLDPDEINDIVNYVRSFMKTPPTFEEVNAVKGNAGFGRIIFNGNCANCHGIDGEFTIASIGPTLKNQTLAGLASKKFWYETIVKGREGTAMPAWHQLDKLQLADLIAFLDGAMEKDIPIYKVLSAINSGKASVIAGEKLFKGNCAVCHGQDAKGGLGPNLKNPELHSLTKADFFYDVMKEGRDGTAMLSWNHLNPGDFADIIAYLESFQTVPDMPLSKARVRGSVERGKINFETVCAQCHGSKDRKGTKMAPAILSKSFLSQVSDQFIKEMAMYGRTGTAMRANLKGSGGYGGMVELFEDEINDVVAYIRSFEDDPLVLDGRASITGDPAVGKHNYKKHCSQCHGKDAQGGTAPGIGKKGFLSARSDGFILAMARMGRPGSEMKSFPPRGDGFSNLTEKDIADIIAFLRSNVDKASSVDKVVQGLPEIGEVIFETNCAQCHGKRGKGGIAPELNHPLFLKGPATDGYLQATMAMGRTNTQMRSMMVGGGGVVELSAPDVNHVISYLRKIQRN